MKCMILKRYLGVILVVFVTCIAFAGLGCGAGIIEELPEIGDNGGIDGGGDEGGGGGEDGGGTGDAGDTTTPGVLSVIPPDFSSMSNTQPVVVTFTESMDTASLVLGGTMGAESDGGVWSTTTNENDTVTVSPAATWTAGVRTFTFNAADPAGNYVISPSISKAAEDGNLTYGVEILFARAGTSGVCFMNDPCEIATAADTATANIAADWSAAEVYVAEGDHEVDASADGQVNVSAGVSLSGGYPIIDDVPDWTARDPVANLTIITDIAAVGGDVPLDPNCPVYALPGVTAASVIDGFRIIGGGGVLSCGIFCNNASPTISNNNIYGGDATTITNGMLNMLSSSPDIQDNTIFGGGVWGGTTNTIGIRNFSGSNPDIQGNDINGGSGTDASIGISNATNCSPLIDDNVIDGGGATDSRGIDNITNSSPTIINNMIEAGNGGVGVTTNYGVLNTDGSASLIQNNVIDGGLANDVRGVFCDNSSPMIYNNTIYGNFADNSNYAIFMLNGSRPGIINNMMYAQNFAMPLYIAIYEGDAASDPDPVVGVRNNNIFEYSGGVYWDGDAGWAIPTVIDMEIDLTGEAILSVGNITEDLSACLEPSNDYRFGLGCNLAAFIFDTSGLDGETEGWDYITDMDGLGRTVPWSMGPYEYD